MHEKGLYTICEKMQALISLSFCAGWSWPLLTANRINRQQYKLTYWELADQTLLLSCNISSNIWRQWRLSWSYASVQSYQSLLETLWIVKKLRLNPGPAEPRYVLSLETVQIKISWLLKKPTDLNLHCLLTGETLIRLHRNTCWSVSSQDAHVLWHIISCCG